MEIICFVFNLIKIISEAYCIVRLAYNTTHVINLIEILRNNINKKRIIGIIIVSLSI